MTIRLLSTYDSFPPQSILTLAPAIEAALIADGNATATLTGGTVAYRERAPVMIQPAVQKHGSVALTANRKTTVPLSEGTALTITPTAGTTGTYQRYDATGAAVGALTPISTGVLTVGPFEGDYTVEVKCTTGSLAAKVADSVLGAAPSTVVAATNSSTARSAAERAKSVASSRAAYEDTASTIFTEAWANLTAWVQPATPGQQISAGRLYATGTAAGGNSGANHSYALAAGENLHAVFQINLPATAGGGNLTIGVSSDAAGAAPAAAQANAFGMSFATGLGIPPNQVSAGAYTPTGQSNLTAGSYKVTVDVDQTYISVTACKTDGTAEYFVRRLRAGFAVNNLYIYNSDPQALTGASVGVCSARKGLQSITPKTFGESLAKSILWTGDGTQDFVVITPPGYDSRIPAPLAIMFHGSTGLETEILTWPNAIAEQRALTNAGYLVLACTLSSNQKTWGNPASCAAYLAAYKYVRDNFAIGPVVIWATSMGGIESLNTIVEGKIPGIVAWIGQVPSTNLASVYANALFTAAINTAYNISGDYAAKTAGRDPVIQPGSAFRGIPMMFLAATDDTTIPKTEHTDIFVPIVTQTATEVLVVNGITGGHTFDITPYLTQAIAFFNKYVSV